MIIFKRTVLSVFVLGASGVQPVIAGSVIPCGSTHKSFFAGIDGLYLQPRNDDLDYVTIHAANNTTTYNTNPDYDWGFRLYGGMKFENNNDVSLTWQRLHTNDSDHFFGDIATPIKPRFITSNTWQSVRANNRFDYDEVSGVLAHTHDFQNNWSVRYGAGAEYARIDSQLGVSTFGAASRLTDQSHIAYSKFKGVGPRLEGNLFYGLTQQVGLFANANTALLIGDRDITSHALNNQFNFSDRHTVVPKLGLRVGASYKHPFGLVGGEGSATTIDFQIGWQTETYFNAVERPAIGLVGGEGSTTINTTTISNYNNQGLFFGVKLYTDCL